MAANRIIDKDLGMKKIQKQIDLMDGSYVLTGYQEGEVTKQQVKGQRTKKGGQSMAQIAFENEFGTSKIPARSFIRSSFDQNRQKINAYIQSRYDLIVEGQQTTKRGLGQIGQFMSGLIVDKIETLRTPPLSRVTIQLKGSDKPLIDFGQMLQSVRYKVVMSA